MSVNINWDELTFSLVPTKEMFVAKSPRDGEWNAGEFLPFGNLSLSPAAGVLNYGQGIFEGLKAYRQQDGKVALFRPDENAKRFAQGAERVCMPSFSETRFVEVMHETVRRNIDYLPPLDKGGLYLRPLMIGSGPILGLAPAPENTMLVFASPVGPYFKKKSQDLLKILISTDYHRAAAKGMGSTKYIGNYAGEMYHSVQAKKRGFNGCVYLDARNDRMIEEVGAANFFCVVKGKLLTPSLGSILPGITRASIIQIAKDMGMEVEEREVDFREALAADECFCTGTAAVLAPIGTLHYDNKDYVFNNNQAGPVAKQLYDKLSGIQTGAAEDPYGWIQHVDITE